MIVSQDTSTTSPLPTRSILLVVVAGLLAGCGLYEDVEPVPEGVPARLLEIDPGTANIGVGETRKVTLSRPDGSQIPGSAVSWSSIDEGIATVDEKGIVTGTGEGSVQIEAVWKGAVKSSAFSVTYQIKSISIDSDVEPQVELGKTTTLTATVTTPGDVKLMGAPVNWESSNSAIVSVTDEGKLTAKEAGEVTVTASLKGESDMTKVTVIEPTEKLIVEPTEKSMGLGEEFCARATPLNLNDKPIEGREVSFTSGDEEVASISKAGAASATVKALKTGGTELNVASQGQSTTVPIDVSEWVDVTAGQNFACGLTANGGAYCWGDNGSGQLGNGTTDRSNYPVEVSLQGLDPAPKFTDIHAGLNHVCAISESKDMYCWGENGASQLGNGESGEGEKETTPLKVNLTGSVADVGMGFFHTCVVTDSGDAYCWGLNDCGQTGNGSPSGCYPGETLRGTPTPQKVAGSTIFESITAGEKHTCGLGQDGDVYCWGWLKDGQLGNGEMNVPVGDPDGETVMRNSTEVDVLYKKSPVKVDPTSAVTDSMGDQPSLPFKDVEAGQRHTCALDNAGRVFCWGQNAKKQAGTLCEYKGTDEMMSQTYTKCAVPSEQPLATPDDMDATGEELFTGSNHQCVREVGGKTSCWGSGETLELGVGQSTDNSATPVHPRTTDDLLTISSGGIYQYERSQGVGFTCATTDEGRISCWGANSRGALGAGSTTQIAEPGNIAFQGCSSEE